LSAVTIGLPYATCASHLRRAIDSIFAQDFRDWELLLVGDGPDEASQRIADSCNDSRIRRIYHGDRRGLAVRLNEIAGAASAPILLRMDADDIMLPSRVSSQVKYLQAHPDVDVISGRAYVIDETDRICGWYSEPPLPKDERGYLDDNALTHPAVAGRTEWFRDNPYDESYARAQDKELWLRTNATSVFAKLDEPVLFYRISTRANLPIKRSTAQADRRLLKLYGPKLTSPADTIYRLARSYAKSAALELIVRSPYEGWLAERRYKELNANEAAVANNAMRRAIDRVSTGD
jgi:glycosyltransferase involved in cell wall biosynthesis